METLIRSNSIDVIVLDSVAALTTKAELDGQMGDVLGRKTIPFDFNQFGSN
jgi:RecA/RadA recombinase